MSDLTDFLLARIAEDEAVAREASPGGWSYGTVDSVAGGSLYDKTRMIGDLHYEQPTDHDGSIVRHLLSPEADANGAHIARHNPARVLAECAAKRAIVERWLHLIEHGDAGSFEWVAKALAWAYRDHTDFDPAWRV